MEGFPDFIQRCLANHSGKVNQDVPANFRKAAVIMPLLLSDGEWQVLFTRRSDTVQDQKGQQRDQMAFDDAARQVEPPAQG